MKKLAQMRKRYLIHWVYETFVSLTGEPHTYGTCLLVRLRAYGPVHTKVLSGRIEGQLFIYTLAPI